MRNHTVCRWLFTAAALILSAGATAQNAVRISEIHYDNASTDAGEAIEVSAPAGTDLTGWQIVLYNGTGGASYDTDTFSGVVPATCGTRGVLVINYPVERHSERRARRRRARRQRRHAGRIPFLRRRLRRHQWPRERRHLHRHRRAAERQRAGRRIAGAQRGWHVGAGRQHFRRLQRRRRRAAGRRSR